jgi:hypothetical protein
MQEGLAEWGGVAERLGIAFAGFVLGNNGVPVSDCHV